MPETGKYKRWEELANKLLAGRKITEVQYLNKTNAENMGWMERGIVFFLDNGAQIIVSQDDEGNGPGSLFYDRVVNKDGKAIAKPVNHTLPVLPLEG
jgi:hypothetical protein